MNNKSEIVAVLLFVVGCTTGGSINDDQAGTSTTKNSDPASTGGSEQTGTTETVGTGGTRSDGTGGTTATTTSGAVGHGGVLGTGGGRDASVGTATVGGNMGSGGSSALGGAHIGAGGFTALGGFPTTGTGGSTGGRTSYSGGTTGTAGQAGSTGPSPSGTSTCLQPGSGKYGEPGPYKTARKDGVDLASLLSGAASPTTYSIIYPDPLEANCLHPIVAWGNGTGVNGQGVYDFFNVNGASWGMVVIASDNSNVGSGQYHKAGIDYLLKENENPSSIFYHKLSTRAGTSGHSQGGMGATVASSHPNVVAEACVAGAGTVGAKVAFMCLTGTADMVESQCKATYQSAPGPSFLADWQGGDHTTTETLAGYVSHDPGTMQMQRLYAAWFRCFLADDQVACAMFRGSPCGMCKESGWATISGKNIK